MRLPAQGGAEVLRAALTAGVTLLDTARAYEGNEALIAGVLKEWKGPRPTVVTKGGVYRDGEAWKVDGRARALREACEKSLELLGEIDLYLLHAPDPNVDFATTVRALARLKDEGLVKAIGLSNVSLPQLRAARELAPIAAVQVALGAYHQAPFRDGVIAAALRDGLTVLAHTPLGGTKRAPGLSKDAVLRRLGDKHGASAQRVVLSWLYGLGIVPLPGARRVETAGDLKPFALDDEDRAALADRFPASARSRRSAAPMATGDGEVVLIMGLPGAGKSTAVHPWLDRGYLRLNRDERGGTLKGLALRLDQALAQGQRKVVLDNTYLTRASRDEVLEVAHRHGLPVRCVFLDTPIDQAQVNLCERSREDEVPPTSLFRMLRQLEPPEPEEGFAEILRVPFARQQRPERSQSGLVVALDAVPTVSDWSSEAPALVVAWRPGALPSLPPGVELGICEHKAGPPKCWCRPPLPGLVVAWAKRHDVSYQKIRFIGEGAAFEALARAFRR